MITNNLNTKTLFLQVYAQYQVQNIKILKLLLNINIKYNINYANEAKTENSSKNS